MAEALAARSFEALGEFAASAVGPEPPIRSFPQRRSARNGGRRARSGRGLPAGAHSMAVTPQKSDVEQVAAHRRIGYTSIEPIAADEPAGLIDIKARLMAGV
jgi:hypothetical protein